jgi:hypothetical protein
LIARGASVIGIAHQRHYRTQRSPADTDAKLEFKLETSQTRRVGQVKPQHEWVEAFAKAARQKRSNVQFQYRVNYPYQMRGLDTRKSLEMMVDGWVALKPVLAMLRG